MLRAIGVEEYMAHTSMRVGFGRFTTNGEVDYAINLIKEQVTRLPDMSPLWEMTLDGVDIKSIKLTQD